MDESERFFNNSYLAEAGKKWAHERAYSTERDSVQRVLKAIYAANVLLWRARRDEVMDIVTQAGGIKGVRDAMWDYQSNYLELQNGQLLYPSKVLHSPELTVAERTDTITNLGQSYKQRHALQMAYGGPLLGGKAEHISRQSDRAHGVASNLKRALEDDLYMPEDIGIIETVETTMLGDGEDKETVNSNGVVYSTSAQIWGRNFMGMSPTPDPYQDPFGYRSWALHGDTQIDVELQAPVVQADGIVQTWTVIDKYGHYRPSGEIAFASLNRARRLLGYYAVRQYPNLFSAQEEQTYGGLFDQPLHIQA